MKNSKMINGLYWVTCDDAEAMLLHYRDGTWIGREGISINQSAVNLQDEICYKPDVEGSNNEPTQIDEDQFVKRMVASHFGFSSKPTWESQLVERLYREIFQLRAEKNAAKTALAASTQSAGVSKEELERIYKKFSQALPQGNMKLDPHRTAIAVNDHQHELLTLIASLPSGSKGEVANDLEPDAVKGMILHCIKGILNAHNVENTIQAGLDISDAVYDRLSAMKMLAPQPKGEVEQKPLDVDHPNGKDYGPVYRMHEAIRQIALRDRVMGEQLHQLFCDVIEPKEVEQKEDDEPIPEYEGIVSWGPMKGKKVSGYALVAQGRHDRYIQIYVPARDLEEADATYPVHEESVKKISPSPDQEQPT